MELQAAARAVKFRSLLAAAGIFLGASGVLVAIALSPGSRVDRRDPGLKWENELLLREGHPYTGTLVEHYENGALYRETHYRDGLKEGAAKEFALNGRLKTLGAYVRGKLEGTETGWFAESPKHFEYHYKNGLLNGVQTEWHPGGELYRREIYADGVVTDKQIFYPDGRAFTNYSERDGRIYGLDGGALCFEKKKEGEK